MKNGDLYLQLIEDKQEILYRDILEVYYVHVSDEVNL